MDRGRGRGAATATRSGWRRRPACPSRSSSRSPTRSATWWRGSRGRTGRSCPWTSPRGSASASRWSSRRSTRWRSAAACRRASSAPAAAGREWVDAEVLRRVRSRSLAALPARRSNRRRRTRWPGSCRRGRGSGRPAPRRADADALYRVIAAAPGRADPGVGAGTAGPAGPAAGLLAGDAGRAVRRRRGRLGRRRRAGERRRLDGAGPRGRGAPPVAAAAPGRADAARRSPFAPRSRTAARCSSARSRPGGRGRTTTRPLLALWELVWAGLVTNDTLAALRALTAGRRAAARRRAAPGGAGPRSRRGWVRRRPPGRWSLTPEREPDSTRRLHAIAEQLLARHGIVTRGAVAAERVTGGFAGVYQVLRVFEDAARCRRGYFVEGLGGAQFAAPGAVDRMRALSEPPEQPRTEVLAAADPANPYGAALPWPDRDAERAGHRPGRKAGAVVVLVDGRLGDLRRARRPDAPHLRRRPGEPAARRGRAGARGPGGRRSAGSRSSGPTAATCSTRRSPGRWPTPASARRRRGLRLRA